MIAWLLAFGWESWDIARWVSVLSRTGGQLESAAAALSQGARKISDTVYRLRSKSEEMEYLDTLLNILPQDKGYLRTQKAISGEVYELRRKVGGRLHGRLHILVDVKANKLYLKKGVTLLGQADCSVGGGKLLVDRKTGRRWKFVTPRGEFKVLSKIDKPVWIKPDWAFVETGQPIPPPNDPSRLAEGELGAYVLNLGDGYLIHGTKDENALGHAVSHGCVRLGAEDLEKLYKTVPVGTRVYIY